MQSVAAGASPAVGFLVGPGVLNHLDGLHAAAERVGVAVINTWGAKGVFRFDSPYHGGTAGLQERDFELAGLAHVDVLVTSGLDPAEVTRAPWEGQAEVVDVAPDELADLARTWPHLRGEPVRPRLYTELAAVVGPMYQDPSSPPARAQAMSETLPADGIVVATPGLVGFWVARTWPTTVPGSVVVPAAAAAGVAEEVAARAAASGRPTALVTAAAASVDGVEVIVWDDDLTIPDALLDVAGPLVAWTLGRP